MRKMIILVVGIAALVLPLAALADGTTPTPASVANQTCAQLKTSMGTAAFAAAYGTNASKSNAFGKCVAKNTAGATATVTNAAQSCKAEQAKDPAAFLAKYGTNGKNGSAGAAKNAFGKCVSAAVKQTQSAQAQAIVKAAASCKAAMKADAAAFVAKYGGKKQNAFGKCVAAASKTK
ncbi:MAG: hypothetical protein ACXVRJ_02745 [Gaiellaceae bacterium]